MGRNGDSDLYQWTTDYCDGTPLWEARSVLSALAEELNANGRPRAADMVAQAVRLMDEVDRQVTARRREEKARV